MGLARTFMLSPNSTRNGHVEREANYPTTKTRNIREFYDDILYIHEDFYPWTPFDYSRNRTQSYNCYDLQLLDYERYYMDLAFKSETYYCNLYSGFTIGYNERDSQLIMDRRFEYDNDEQCTIEALLLLSRSNPAQSINTD